MNTLIHTVTLIHTQKHTQTHMTSRYLKRHRETQSYPYKFINT